MTRIVITLDIEGDESDALDAVEAALDTGVLQEEINEYEPLMGDAEVRVASATCELAETEESE